MTAVERAAHPDYSGALYLDPSSGDRCVCSGVRYWHAKAPYGCDDCPCEEFTLASEPPGDGVITQRDLAYAWERGFTAGFEECGSGGQIDATDDNPYLVTEVTS